MGVPGMNGRSKKILTALVLGGVVVYAGFLVGHARNGTRTAETHSSAVSVGDQVGDLAPNFQLQTTTGQTVTLKSLRGHPVWLNFWATWCPWCKKEIPVVAEEYAQHHGAVDVVGVDVEEPSHTVKSYIKSHGLRYPVVLDSQGSVSASFGVTGLPTSVFIRPDGRIAEVYTGAIDTPMSAQKLLAPLLGRS